MGFDYGNTCSDIDSDINDFKGVIQSYLEDILDEVCPMFEGEKKDVYIKDSVSNIHSDCEGIFEHVRACNSDMRTEADRQIDRAGDRISDVESELSEANERISELEDEIKDISNE